MVSAQAGLAKQIAVRVLGGLIRKALGGGGAKPPASVDPLPWEAQIKRAPAPQPAAGPGGRPVAPKARRKSPEQLLLEELLRPKEPKK